MKNFYFLCALPRTGATFLGSVINQSRQIQMTGNSIVPEIFFNILKAKDSDTFKNFPYHAGFDQILLNVFNHYYQNLEHPNILDKAPWGTPFNLSLLKCLFKKRKFVILERPVLECLASLVKAKTNKQNIDEFCRFMMDKEQGILGKNLWSIQNIINQNEQHIIVSYNDLVNDTQKQIDRIFEFLELEKEIFNLNNLKQFEFDTVQYDDTKVSGNYHTIRVDNIKKIDYKVEEYLPKEIINQYKDIKI